MRTGTWIERSKSQQTRLAFYLRKRYFSVAVIVLVLLVRRPVCIVQKLLFTRNLWSCQPGFVAKFSVHRSNLWIT